MTKQKSDPNTTSVRIPTELHEELAAIKEREGIPIMWQITTAVAEWLEKRKRPSSKE